MGSLEAGLASIHSGEGPLRVRLSIARGFGFDGGHDEDHGVDPGGSLVTVPEHRHEVEMDFTRIQLQVDYALTEPWGLTLRIPYDIKDRSAHIGLVGPASTAEETAMEANLNLHHPDKTLHGFSDFYLLAGWHGHSLGTDGDQVLVSIGTSLPVGRTEENPYALGAEAEAHEHVQFGSGTFDPLLEGYYVRPLGDDWRFTLFGTGRFPLYENHEDYRGSRSITLGVDATFEATSATSWGLGVLYQREGFAEWDGARDINSGFTAFSLRGSLSRRLKNGHRWSLALIVPLETDTLASDGEAFRPGPILSLGYHL